MLIFLMNSYFHFYTLTKLTKTISTKVFFTNIFKIQRTAKRIFGTSFLIIKSEWTNVFEWQQDIVSLRKGITNFDFSFLFLVTLATVLT